MRRVGLLALCAFVFATAALASTTDYAGSGSSSAGTASLTGSPTLGGSLTLTLGQLSINGGGLTSGKVTISLALGTSCGAGCLNIIGGTVRILDASNTIQFQDTFTGGTVTVSGGVVSISGSTTAGTTTAVIATLAGGAIFASSDTVVTSSGTALITLVSQSGGTYNYAITFSGCTGSCFAVLNGQQATLSGMSGVSNATVLSTNLLNECYTVGSFSPTIASFVDTLGSCSFGPGTLQAFQIISSSTTMGTIQYSIQTDLGTFTGTTHGPVGQPTNPCSPPTFAEVVAGGVVLPSISPGDIQTTFQPGCGLTLKAAAALGGYDHFNWVQVITQHDGLAVCQKFDLSWPTYAPICSFAQGLVTESSTFPIVPFFDVPPGGFQYQVDACSAGSFGPCSFPVKDTLPWYWDEKYTAFFQLPNSPAIPTEVQQESCIGFGCQTLSFEDMPSCNLLLIGAPCTIRFTTTLVGVRSDGSGDALNIGACQTGVPLNCLNNVGTGFNWHVLGSSLTIDGRLQNFQPDPNTSVFFDSFKAPGAVGFSQPELQVFAQNGINIRGEKGVIMPLIIDIKPGDSPNSINPRSPGTIPVAILSTAGFHAIDLIDRGSLTFGRSGTERSLASCRPADVNGDGLMDLVCNFYTSIAAFKPGDTEGRLGGKTRTGTPVFGADPIVIVPQP